MMCLMVLSLSEVSSNLLFRSCFTSFDFMSITNTPSWSVPIHNQPRLSAITSQTCSGSGSGAMPWASRKLFTEGCHFLAFWSYTNVIRLDITQ